MRKHDAKRRRRQPGHGRRNTGNDYIYGRQPVREVLRAGHRKIERLWVSERAVVTPDLTEIIELAQAAGADIIESAPAELDRMVSDGNHQGVAIQAGPYRYLNLSDVIELVRNAGKETLLLCLDHLEDPQNVGGLLRSAEAAGVTAVLIPKDRAAHVTPAAIRASAGAAEHVPVAIVVNLVQAIRQLKEEGVWFAGLDAGPESEPVAACDLSGPWGIVVGAEGKGLGRLVKDTCDRVISLPLYGRVSSLNAAVAAALALYEVRRRRIAATD